MSLKSWQWNEHEDAALHALQNHRAAILYMRGLRKHMDYATGVVGIQRKVSLRMFVELLEERREPGSHQPAQLPTVNTVRWCLTNLERVGLIQRMPKQHRMEAMIFKLPLASTDLIRFEEEQQGNNKAAATNENIKNIGKNSIKQNSNNKMNNKEEQHTSGISGKDNTSANAEELHSNMFGLSVSQNVSRVTNFACPHQEILKIWDEVMPAAVRRPRSALWLADRAGYKNLAGRWKQCFEIIHSQRNVPLYSDRESGLVWWRGFFVHCTRSPFLMEQCRPFDLPWLVKKENFIKVQEGNYHDAK
jgi:hypothetical protein